MGASSQGPGRTKGLAERQWKRSEVDADGDNGIEGEEKRGSEDVTGGGLESDIVVKYQLSARGDRGWRLTALGLAASG
jgi:hypothetical protein